jgi:hypothetical protein
MIRYLHHRSRQWGCFTRSIPFLCIALSLVPLRATAADKCTLTGVVRNALTSEPLAAANIRVIGTTRGTITNTEGSYSLTLDAGDYALLVTMVGYTPDTLLVALRSSIAQDVALRPAEIILPEVLATSEDPAVEIMRRAIARKHQWIDNLFSYRMEAFTRQILRRDTSIASITESYSTGYWQQGDTLREVIRQRRQTANIQSSFNPASVGVLLNFNDNRVRFLGYSFCGPIADDALEHYDFKLLLTRSTAGQDIYHIGMTPKTATVPLFSGTIDIAGNSYALIGVDVTPNEAFILPFVQEWRLRYRQQFSLYDSTFWLPTDIRIEGSFDIGFPGLTLPRIGISQTSVISGYAVNVPLPDSLFHKPRLVVDSTATTFDSTYWASHDVLPLNPEERHAYASIDSSQSLEVQFRPGGLAATLGSAEGIVGTIFTYEDFLFNRVEGLHIGVKGEFDHVTPILGVSATLGYGTSSKLTTYLLQTELFTSTERTFGFGGEISRSVKAVGGAGPYGRLWNSLTALVAKNDYYDYYGATGWSVSLLFRPLRPARASLTYAYERDRSMSVATNYSFFHTSRDYRPNPEVDEGTLRSVRMDIRLGEDAVPLDLVTRDAADISIEHTAPWLGGDFTFTRFSFIGSASFTTFGTSFLLKPTLRVQLAVGLASRTLPRQRMFTIETASSGYAPFAVMRAMDTREFVGARYLAVRLEHNFRSIPFLFLHIPFLYRNGIEFIITGGAARAWDATWNDPAAADRLYYEAGFAISRIFGLARTDFTWRLSPPTGFAFTVSVATLF